MNLLQRIGREPNAITGVITAAINLLVLFSLIHPTLDQLAGINTFLGAVFFFVRWLTTPSAEVVAQRQPGEATKAGPAAESGPGFIPVGTPVEVVTGPQPPAP